MAIERLKLPVIVAAGVVAVSAASILIKLARLEQVPPLVIAAFRLGLASIVLTPFTWNRVRTEIRRLTRGEFLLAVTSGVFLALHFTFWISSFDYTSVMSSVVFVATNPLFVALASILILHEAVDRSIWTGIVIAMIGGALVGAADLGAGQGTASGDLLALGGAACASIYVLIGRRLRAKLSLLAYIGIVYTISALLLIALALLSGASFQGYSLAGYLFLVLIALVPQVIGHSSINYALKYLSAALVALLLLAEPIGATLLAIPVFGEIPGPLKLVGGVLVLLGIFVASRGGEKTAETETEIEAATLE